MVGAYSDDLFHGERDMEDLVDRRDHSDQRSYCPSGKDWASSDTHCKPSRPRVRDEPWGLSNFFFFSLYRYYGF